MTSGWNDEISVNPIAPHSIGQSIIDKKWLPHHDHQPACVFPPLYFSTHHQIERCARTKTPKAPFVLRCCVSFCRLQTQKSRARNISRTFTPSLATRTFLPLFFRLLPLLCAHHYLCWTQQHPRICSSAGLHGTSVLSLLQHFRNSTARCVSPLCVRLTPLSLCLFTITQNVSCERKCLPNILTTRVDLPSFFIWTFLVSIICTHTHTSALVGRSVDRTRAVFPNVIFFSLPPWLTSEKFILRTTLLNVFQWFGFHFLIHVTFHPPQTYTQDWVRFKYIPKRNFVDQQRNKLVICRTLVCMSCKIVCFLCYTRKPTIFRSRWTVTRLLPPPPQPPPLPLATVTNVSNIFWSMKETSTSDPFWARRPSSPASPHTQNLSKIITTNTQPSLNIITCSTITVRLVPIKIWLLPQSCPPLPPPATLRRPAPPPSRRFWSPNQVNFTILAIRSLPSICPIIRSFLWTARPASRLRMDPFGDYPPKTYAMEKVFVILQWR